MPEDLIKRLDPTLGSIKSTKKIPQLVPVNRVRVEQSKDPCSFVPFDLQILSEQMPFTKFIRIESMHTSGLEA
jgi:hypothetical protein